MYRISRVNTKDEAIDAFTGSKSYETAIEANSIFARANRAKGEKGKVR